VNFEEIMSKLSASGIENARFEAEQMMRSLPSDQLPKALERRCAGYPLQYLLGEWDFCHETYEVSEDCLIPRADTELLVERAAKLLPASARFLDLCTGSGCIAISTLCARPDTCAVAVEFYEKTMALAQRNATRNGVGERLAFLRADVLCPPPASLQGGFHAILSNPPYIRADVMQTLQREVQHEPPAALCGGEDGLDFYRAILTHWAPLLAPDGFLLFEIGYDQREALAALAEKHGFSHTGWRDLGGNDRVVLLQK
jgi:release factor glutamine methyltransferase